VRDRLGREGSKFSIAKRPKVEVNESIKIPGPAAYNIKPPEMRGGFKFGSSGNTNVGSLSHIESSSSPGPGQYDVRTRYKNFKQNAPAWKYYLKSYIRMGTEQREKSSDSLNLRENPGPGSYASKSFLGEGPKITIKQKGNNVSESLTVPGPGAYEPKLEAIIRKFPNVGIGHSKKDDAISYNASANAPGPGYYLLNELGKGPKYGFGTGKRQPDRFNDVPGPGQYEIPTRIGDGDLPPHERSKHF
jgi:hypothetical protein